MKEMIIQQSTEVVQQGSIINEELFGRFIAYLDASQKTIDTYTRAIKQFFKYMYAAGISEPRREDILAYREYLKGTHKPTTVQNYIVAVRLLFQWTEQEGIYPNIANHIKGAKICLLYTSPSPRDRQKSRMPSSA